MIDNKSRLVIESYILDMYVEENRLAISVLQDLYKQLVGEPFDISAAVQRGWGVCK